MSFFEHFDWSFRSIAKIIGMVLFGLIVITVAVSLISFSFRTIFQTTNSTRSGYPVYEDSADGYNMKMLGEVSYAPSSIAPRPDYSSGADAEAYEVKRFNAYLRVSRLGSVCDEISALKAREDVIFENSTVGDYSCNFSFKVESDSTDEIVAMIEAYDPDDFNTNIQSIKSSVDYYDKQLDILEKKLASIEETLNGALDAYDDVNRLAVQQRDVESLATIINNKLELIERMSRERISVQQQIDSYHQQKADQLDRLQYSFFDVNVQKDLIFDWERIKESWNGELKSFVNNFNAVLQQISVGLLTYLVRFAQAMIYLFLSLFLLKYVWIGMKRLWKHH